jgi:uncharacterized phage protein (TIGR02220 family)
MSQIFEIVQAMSGQKNSITIPVPYLDFFAEDQQAHALGAMLNQLVFWSGKSDLNNGWFYKEHAELASEIRGVSADQVQRMAKKICQRWLPGVVEMKQAQVNGTKKTHYRVHGEALIAHLFPPAMDSAESQNGKREVAEPVPQNRKTETAESQNPGREVAEPILYTDLDTDTDKQIIKPLGQPAAQTDREVEITDQAKTVLSHLNTVTGSRYQVSKSSLENIRARLREDFSVDDLVLVVDYSQEKWGSDIKMAEYLRPATLFQNAKFPGYLQSATKWHEAGRPANVNGKWVMPGDTQQVDTVERDKAYKRFTGSALPKAKPSELELRVRKAASTENLGKQRPEFSASRWKAIWKEQAQLVSQGEVR